MDTDLESAKDMYATALELGRRSAAYSLGLYWEGRWDKSVPCDVVPDSTKSAQAYKCGGSNPKCAARLDAFRARSRQITPIARADARKSELCVLAYALG